MIGSAMLQALLEFIPEENIHMNEAMSAHTTFRVGGPADCLIEISDALELQRVQKLLCQVDCPYVVIGNGSNLLVSDRGYEGVVLLVGKKMSEITVVGDTVVAQAGASMAQVANAAWKHGLTGLEFASGIPGTVGGGVVMNAGAYGGELAQVVVNVEVLTKDGEFLTLDNETMEFGYRKSTIRNKPFIVTSVTFMLSPGNPEEIKAKMDELAVKRREKQPLEFPSAGSTFKRPEGYFAGELIMNAGLRGYRIGGAQVAEKHCGFIINAGDATAGNIMDLIEEVTVQVKEQFNVTLEPEVVFLGQF